MNGWPMRSVWFTLYRNCSQSMFMLLKADMSVLDAAKQLWDDWYDALLTTGSVRSSIRI